MANLDVLQMRPSSWNLRGPVMWIVVWGVSAGGGTQGVLGEDEVWRRMDEDEGIVVVVEGWLWGIGEEERSGW